MSEWKLIETAPIDQIRVEQIDIVFDSPPGPKSGRFVEVEDGSGKSIKFGEWIERTDGLWALRIPANA